MRQEGRIGPERRDRKARRNPGDREPREFPREAHESGMALPDFARKDGDVFIPCQSGAVEKTVPGSWPASRSARIFPHTGAMAFFGRRPAAEKTMTCHDA